MAVIIPFEPPKARCATVEPLMIDGRVLWYHSFGEHHSDTPERRAFKEEIRRFVSQHQGPCAIEAPRRVSQWNTADLWDFLTRMTELTPENVPIAFYGGPRQVGGITFCTFGSSRSASYNLSVRCTHGFDVAMDLPEPPPAAAILGVLARRGGMFRDVEMSLEPKRRGVKTTIRM